MTHQLLGNDRYDHGAVPKALLSSALQKYTDIQSATHKKIEIQFRVRMHNKVLKQKMLKNYMIFFIFLITHKINAVALGSEP